jgi:hypothetical protein
MDVSRHIDIYIFEQLFWTERDTFLFEDMQGEQAHDSWCLQQWFLENNYNINTLTPFKYISLINLVKRDRVLKICQVCS